MPSAPSLPLHNRCFSPSFSIFIPPLFQLNNKKLFSLACYLTAVLWIDGCVHACAWQLLCTPNEFNHQARCQHVISSLCLLGERWNYSGRNGGGGRRQSGRGGRGGQTEDVCEKWEGKQGNRRKEDKGQASMQSTVKGSAGYRKTNKQNRE